MRTQDEQERAAGTQDCPYPLQCHIRIRPELVRMEGGHVCEVPIRPTYVPIGTLPDIDVHRGREAREPCTGLRRHQRGGIDARQEPTGHPGSEHCHQGAGPESDLEYPGAWTGTDARGRALISRCIEPFHGHRKQPTADAMRLHSLTDPRSSAHTRAPPFWP